jgi:hypothetical protein
LDTRLNVRAAEAEPSGPERRKFDLASTTKAAITPLAENARKIVKKIDRQIGRLDMSGPWPDYYLHLAIVAKSRPEQPMRDMSRPN